jgi:hypothetical protein
MRWPRTRNAQVSAEEATAHMSKKLHRKVDYLELFNPNSLQVATGALVEPHCAKGDGPMPLPPPMPGPMPPFSVTVVGGGRRGEGDYDESNMC